ncbi:MAG: hypothetical protein IJN92_01520 [Lachnospiraceae bacterium]|nr:hypothetical protein [Lachnospiraceae bacterium]
MERKCSNCGAPMIRISNGYQCTFCANIESLGQPDRGSGPSIPNVPRKAGANGNRQTDKNSREYWQNQANQSSRNNRYGRGDRKKLSSGKIVAIFITSIFVLTITMRIVVSMLMYPMEKILRESETADTSYQEDYQVTSREDSTQDTLPAVKDEYRIQSPVMKQAVEDMFGKPFEEVTKQDVEKVRYLKIETSGIDQYCRISYSFEDFKVYPYEEMDPESFPYSPEFLATVRTNTYDYDSREAGDVYEDVHNFSGVSGLNLEHYNMNLSDFSNLTYIDCSNEDMEDVIATGLNADGIEILKITDQEDMSKITQFTSLKKLYADCCHVEDLEYIAKCQNLETFYCLNMKGTKSFSPLGEMTGLKKLYVEGSTDGLKDLSMISNLTNLESLAIIDTDILNLNFLESLTGLKALRLVGNGELQDYTALGNLVNLEYLDFDLDDLNGNQPDYEGLKNLKKLKHLSLNVVYNLDFLYELINLEELEIKICFYNNLLEPIRQMGHLKTLSLIQCNSQFPDGFACLNELPELKKLTIQGMEFDEAADGLFQLNNLEELHIKSCQFYVAPAGIASNNSLKVLELQSVEFITMPGPDSEYYYVGYNDEEISRSVLNGFGSCSGLEKLYLDWYLVTDLSFLKNYTNLKVLSMSNCELSEIGSDSLLACTQLEELNVSENTISTLDFVAGLSNLKDINLENCYVSDLSPLTSCPNLKYVNAKGNPISQNPLENVAVEE